MLSTMIDYITTAYRWRNQMLDRFLCNVVQRESVKTSRGAISGIFCSTPLLKIRYGIQIYPHPRVSGKFLLGAWRC